MDRIWITGLTGYPVIASPPHTGPTRVSLELIIVFLETTILIVSVELDNSICTRMELAA